MRNFFKVEVVPFSILKIVELKVFLDFIDRFSTLGFLIPLPTILKWQSQITPPLIRRITVELEATNTEARNNLGYLYLQIQKNTEAEIQFRSALEYEPQSIDLVFGLAVALVNQNKNAMAKPFLLQTLALDPNHTGAKNFLEKIRDQN